MVMEVRIFSLGAGADTVMFGASKAANGEDTITNFTAGATSGDVLNVSAFTGSGSSAGKVQIESTTAGTGDLSSKLVLVSKKAISADIFDGTGTTKFRLDNNQKLFVVDTTDNSLYFVTAATDMSSGSATVEKVGTITATGDWNAANFA